MSHPPAIRTLLCPPLLSFAFLFCGSQVQPPAEAPAETNAKTNKTLDACSLLTGAEIAAVLGEPLQERKPSVQAAGSMKMSHCLFVTRDFAKSASLAVSTPAADDSGARRLRAFWRNQFHSPVEHQEESRPALRKIPAAASGPDGESESEAEAEAGKPRPIPGLGEEAYWVGSPLAGALYVLRGDLFLRISVGGIPKESTRIAKSKSIANAVLPRLRR